MRALVFGFLVLALVAAGCSGDDDATAPTTASSGSDEVDAVEPGSLVLVFDGEDCSYDGPTELEAGPAEFVFVNDSDGPAAANMVSIDEGYTVQDVIDHLGPQPSGKHHPAWTREVDGV